MGWVSQRVKGGWVDEKLIKRKEEVLLWLVDRGDLKVGGYKAERRQARNESGFRLACEHQEWEVVSGLILECEIEKTKEIQSLMKSHEPARIFFRIQEEQKEFNESLKREGKGPKVEVKNTRVLLKRREGRGREERIHRL